MPTIGSASIDVNYDGDDLPRQAREIGEEAGRGMGEEHADAFDEEVRRGAGETFDRENRESRLRGRNNGERYGVSFADSMDDIMRRRLKATSDDIAKVFSDPEGVRNFVRNYEGAGEATDHLREKIRDLHDQGVLTDKQAGNLSRRLIDFEGSADRANGGADRLNEMLGRVGRTVGDGNDGLGGRVDDFGESVDRLGRRSEDSREPIRLLNGDIYNLMTGELIRRDRVDDLSDSVGDLGDSSHDAAPDVALLGDRIDDINRGHIDEVTGQVRDLGNTTRTAGGDIDHGNGAIRDLADNVDDIGRRSGGLDGANDRIARLGNVTDTAGGKLNRHTPDFQRLVGVIRDLPDADRIRVMDGLGDSLERLGDASYRGGGRATTGSAGFRDLRRDLGRFERDGGLSVDALDALGDAIFRFGDSGHRGGDGAGLGAGGFAKLGGALANFDPADNMGQLFALIIALAPQIATLASAAGGGLTILAGGVAAFGLAAIGGAIGFSNLFGDLKKVDPEVRPAAEAVQGFVDKFPQLRATLQKAMFDGLVGEIDNLKNTAIPALNTAFGTIGSALNSVLGGMVRDLNSSGFKDDINTIADGAKPSIENIGKLFRTALGIVGEVLKQTAPDVQDFTKGLSDMAQDFLDFLKSPKGHTEVREWLDDAKTVLGHVGGAIDTVAGAFKKLVTPENLDETVSTIDSLADAVKHLVKAGDDLSPAVPKIAAALDGISKSFADQNSDNDEWIGLLEGVATEAISIFKNMASSIGSYIDSIGTQLTGTSKALGQALTGDFAGAAKTMDQAIRTANDQVTTAGQKFAAATGDMSASFDTLDSHSKEKLGQLSRNLGLSGDDAKSFSGRVAEMAQDAGVSLSDLAKDQSLDDVRQDLGLTKGAAGFFFDGFSDAMHKSVGSAADLDRGANQSLDAVSHQLGLTGTASGNFKDAVATASGGSTKALQGLADDRSLADVEHSLGITGDTARNKFETNLVTAMRNSKVDVDKLPPSFDTLKDKIDAVPKNPKVTTGESGAAEASGRVQTLHDKIDALKDKIVDAKARGASESSEEVQNLRRQIENLQSKEVTVTTHFATTGSANDSGLATTTAARRASGGLFSALGDKIARYASGGITSGPTLYHGGRSLVGEAGPEAIVPLSGALSSVDRSVRALSAFARGRTISGSQADASTGRQLAIGAGAIQVYTQGLNERQVGSAVLDRLTSVLG